MGIILGSGGFTRFQVDGELPEGYLETLQEKIARYAFRGLGEDSDEERATGWVQILDMFENDFTGMDYLKEPCIALAWRVDVKRVPPIALSHYCREAEKKIMASEKVEYLPKRRIQEIREAVRIKLLKRAIPVSRTYDMIWNLQTGIVFFGGTSNKLCDEFAEFFLKCFGFPLKTVFPYSMACRVLEQEERDPSLLDALEYSIRLGGE
ncbi:MAG: recombination-associated protein RdgC [Deltaproteobacteria bacterium]|nr:recombination-associated protein RdgC [Deltaproteobacteria bacterium]